MASACSSISGPPNPEPHRTPGIPHGRASADSPDDSPCSHRSGVGINPERPQFFRQPLGAAGDFDVGLEGPAVGPEDAQVAAVPLEPDAGPWADPAVHLADLAQLIADPTPPLQAHRVG